MGSQNQSVRIFICTGGSWERVYGVLRYKPLGLPRRILQLPLKLTFSGLMTCVARKLNLSLQTGFRLTYQFPINRNKNEVVDIADEEDVEIFMDIALKMSHGLITLYVVESVPGLCEAQNTEARNRPITGKNVAGTSGKRTNVLDLDDDFGDASDLFGDQKGGNPLKNTGALNGAGVYTVSTAAQSAPVSNLQEKAVDYDADEDISWLTLRAPQVSCKQERGGDGESEDTLISLDPPSPPAPAPDVTRRDTGGNTAGKDIFWWMQPLPPGPSGYNYLEKGAGSRGGKDIFWDMPPPLPDPGPCSNSKSHKVFNSKEAMRLSLKLKSLEEGFKIKTARSTTDKYEVRCVSCDWRISGTRIHDTDMFQVKDFEVQHKCSRLQGSPNHR